jgi:hypothetical protein
MGTNVVFPNWQSRLLLRGVAQRQPLEPARFPPLVDRFFQWYERRVLGVDTSAVPLDRPIFLLGTPRSGTTMLQDLLCSHQDVAYVNNTMHRVPTAFCVIDHYRRRLQLDFEAERYLQDSVRVTAGSPSDAVAFWARWFGVDPFSFEYRAIQTADLSPATVAEMQDTIRKFIWCFGRPYRRFFSKLLAVIQYTHVVKDLFPQAKFVHIVRDARFTANSMLKHCRREIEHQRAVHGGAGPKDGRYFIPYPRFPRLAEYVSEFGLENIRTTAHLWNDILDYFDTLKASIPCYLEVRFEDLVAAPRERLAEILEFCELAPVPADNRAFWGRMEKVGKVGHQNKYSSFEVVEEICHEQMRKHGYLD